MEYVIGIDIGTTHCKSVAMSVHGELLKQIQSGYPTIQQFTGQSEQEPEAVFNEVIELLHQTISDLGQHQLQAIAFSSAMHSIMAVDNEGKPLTNAYTWADIRSEEIADRWIAEGKQQLLYASIGVPLHPMLPLCKIKWMQVAMPSIFSAAKKFISIKEYIFCKLFGTYVVDFSTASASGFFDLENFRWNKKALELAGIDEERLSTLVPVDHFETELREEYKKRLGIQTHVPFIIGSTDGCLANIGSGAFDEGEGAVTIGTSGAVRVLTSKLTADVHQRLFNYAVTKNCFVCGGPVNNGGIVLSWFAEQFLGRKFESASDFQWFLSEAIKVKPGSNGLIFLPYLLGERAPHWDAGLRAGFVGLNINHHREHMIRAVVEGVSFGIKAVLQATEETYGEIHSLFASGGFTQSDVWLQMVADILNKKIVVAGEVDASALGAIAIALQATGYIQDFRATRDWLKIKKTFHPDGTTQKAYQVTFDSFQTLTLRLKDYYSKRKGDNYF
jgi:gluconokinase